MRINIDGEILAKYPDAEIGFLIAEVSVRQKDEYVENLKSSLKGCLDNQGINSTNFAIHPGIAIWRQIYEENFQVKAKTYRSSIESLVKRVVSGKEIWNICNVVDLYNCCSILSLLPMGGYDLAKISGDIAIRHAKTSETFLGLGERAKIEVKSNHVVYADEEKIICWLWNHKDSLETCIDEHSKQVVFFVDSFDNIKTRTALNQLEKHLKQIHCIPLDKGVLNKTCPQVDLNVKKGN